MDTCTCHSFTGYVNRNFNPYFNFNPMPDFNPLRGPLDNCNFGPPVFGPGQDFYAPSPPPLDLMPDPFRPKPAAAASSKPFRINLKPMKQSNDWSCGQTSVAMAVRKLTGRNIDDKYIDAKYGLGLLHALQSETGKHGYTWKDREFIPSRARSSADRRKAADQSWKQIDKRLRLGRPVLMGMNGPKFSPSGRGHIITLLGINGDKVTFADPADGKIRTLSKRDFENSPGHPDGKFVFYADRDRPVIKH